MQIEVFGELPTTPVYLSPVGDIHLLHIIYVALGIFIFIFSAKLLQK